MTNYGNATKQQSINVKPYAGQKATIKEIDQKNGQWGPFIIVKTDTVFVHKGKERDINVTASRTFNVVYNEETKAYDWPTEGNLDLFLKKHKCRAPEDLLEKEVSIIVITKKDGSEYLGIE